MDREEKKILLRIRFLTILFITALFLSGITAFPLEFELSILSGLIGVSPGNSMESYNVLQVWIATVYNAITDININYPFLAYGTDWLAFAHIVIAILFGGVYFKPVRNIWIVYFGMIACVGIIPLALICGHIRHIPFFWQLIDCSFGIFGIIPLYFLSRDIRKLADITGYIPHRY